MGIAAIRNAWLAGPLVAPTSRRRIGPLNCGVSMMATRYSKASRWCLPAAELSRPPRARKGGGTA